MRAIKQWTTANGGPLALVFLGLALLAVYKPLGVALVGIGVVWFVLTLGFVKKLLQKFPYRIVKKKTPRYQVTESQMAAFMSARERRRKLRLRVQAKVR